MEENKKYNIIYADPPWDYGNTKNLDGEFWGMADKHYDVMKFKDICNLPVQNIAADDCYLFSLSLGIVTICMYYLLPFQHRQMLLIVVNDIFPMFYVTDNIT